MTRAARIRELEHKISVKKDSVLAAYELIAEQQPKVTAMEKELSELRASKASDRALNTQESEA